MQQHISETSPVRTSQTAHQHLLQELADRHAAAVADLEAGIEVQQAALQKEAAILAREAARAAEDKAAQAHQTESALASFS